MKSIASLVCFLERIFLCLKRCLYSAFSQNLSLILMFYSFCSAGPNQNVTVSNPQESFANLTGLRPYTTYSISIAVLSSAGESLPSDPLYNVTLEAGKHSNSTFLFWSLRRSGTNDDFSCFSTITSSKCFSC